MQVPEGWEIKKLKDFALSEKGSFVNGPFGSDLLSSELTSTGVPVIYIRDISNGVYDRVSEVHVTKDKARKLHSCQTNYGDLLITKVGDPPCIAALYNQKELAIITQDVIRIRTGETFKSLFLKYLINSDIGQKTIFKIEIKGTRRRVSLTDFKSVRLPFPPLAEQEKIAEILSTWDRAIEQTERLKANAETHKQALMQQLLTGKKRFPEFEGEWKEYRLSKLGETFNGLSGKTAKDFGTGKPFITYKNIFDNSKIDITKFEYVNIEDNENQQKVERGDLFFTTSSETPEEVGMSSVMLDTPTEDLYLNSFCFGLRLFEANRLLPEFAQFLFRSNHVRQKIILLAQGSTRFNLSKIAFMKIKIKLPSLEEQQKIAAVLNTADREIELLTQKLDHLKTEKRALMQQLLTGKRRVKVDG